MMKIKRFVIAICLMVLTMLAACGAAYPEDLVSADNVIASVQGSDVESIKAGMAYGDIITKLGATRDYGMGDDAHTAVYLVDGDSFLYLSFAKLTNKCPQSGLELLAGVQSAVGIRGIVTDITAVEDGVTMMVEEEPDVDMLMKASIRMDEKTVVIRENGGMAGIGDIKTGDTVEVVFDGAVAESYPLQGRALRVTILDSSAQ